MDLKNRTFSFIEMFVQCVKYRGFFAGLKISYHYIFCRFFPSLVKNKTYKFLGYKMKLANIEKFAHILFELFGINVYYFKSLKKNPVIIDIGANIGDSILYFKWLYPDSKIYAFEPLPIAYQLLQKNIINNHLKNVYAFNVGLGSNEKKIKIYSDLEGTSGSSTINKKASGSQLKNSKYQDVKIVKISNLKEIKALNKINLIKIDIEGAEADLLDDLKNILPKTDRVIFEYHVVPNISENSFDKIVKILRESQFSLSFSGFYRFTNNESNPFAFLIFASK
ncbi:MAG: methyltransferase FkbM family [uncultured bacterium]|nr:MAG: methyltransferase FkbM family [uncultured bacterium]